MVNKDAKTRTRVPKKEIYKQVLNLQLPEVEEASEKQASEIYTLGNWFTNSREAFVNIG